MRKEKVFIQKRSDHFKKFVWCGSLVSTCFQLQRHNIFKSGLFDCQRLPLAVWSLATFNKTYNSCHTPVTLPQVKCLSICMVTLTFGSLLDWLCNFLSYGDMSVYKNVNHPRQSVYLKFCTTSHNYDMHVHARFPWPDLGQYYNGVWHLQTADCRLYTVDLRP